MGTSIAAGQNAAASTIAIHRTGKFGARKPAERGFSLLEVVISMAILTVGLVSLLGVFGLAMASTQTSQEDMIAKQLANESLESIITARNTSQITWANIQNVTACPASSSGGYFLSGAQPIYQAGVDGIYGTCDDQNAPEQTLTEPGPDGIYGTADDVQVPLTGYQRTILISAVNDASGNPVASLRAVNITVQYTTSQAKLGKTYVLSSFISQYQ
jgi:prepilin-type N-terminal cleavage/methylation domain-containing protein